METNPMIQDPTGGPVPPATAELVQPLEADQDDPGDAQEGERQLRDGHQGRVSRDPSQVQTVHRRSSDTERSSFPGRHRPDRRQDHHRQRSGHQVGNWSQVILARDDS